MRLINLHPSRRAAPILGIAPFLLLCAGYIIASEIRLAANAEDKLLPSLGQMATAIGRMAFHQDMATGQYLMLSDTLVSLDRLFTGLAISTAISFILGIAVGMLPYLKRLMLPFITAVSAPRPISSAT